MSALLQSCLCTQAQLESPPFTQWLREMGIHNPWPHRKLWEYAYIAQALAQRGMLQPGRRGLGFAVGQEPLVALFARYGCEVVATDLPPDNSGQEKWATTGQHVINLQKLREQSICDPEVFERHVSLRFVNMNHIPNDLRDFDFVWSACALEHLGSLRLGKRFLQNMLCCLKPGGLAIHTTEFNTLSDSDTIKKGDTVLFRKKDIEQIDRWLKERGHHIELDFTPGTGEADLFIDTPPFDQQRKHLKLQFGSYVITSIGLVIEKAKTTQLVSGRWFPWPARWSKRVS